MAGTSQTKQFVRDLKDRDAVTSIFLASEKMVLTDRNGKSYMSFNLSDASGSINARAWDKVEDLARLFEAGDFVRVKGHVQTYQNRRQVIVHDVQRAQGEDVELKDFVRSAVEDPSRMWARLERHVSELKDEHIRQLVQDTLVDREIKERLLKAPAAKTIHHAYMGGLLEHIVSICDLMESLARHYPSLNRDLLVFGAIFHDIGKIWELQIEEGIKYTDRGRLVGHMVIACELVEQKAARILGFPQELRDILKHIILSHHGRLEYGSPKEPAFPEAMVVAMIDELDSRLNTVFNFMRGELQSGESWTRLHAQSERYYYLDILRRQETEAEPSDELGK